MTTLKKIIDNMLGNDQHFNFLTYKQTDSLIKRLIDGIKDSKFTPELVVGISNGGDYPALQLSEEFKLPLSFIRINHYNFLVHNLHIPYSYNIFSFFGYKPTTLLIRDIPKEQVELKKVLIVDDDSYSGETLKLAKDIIKNKKALEVKVALIQTHSENKIVDFIGGIYNKEAFFEAKYRFPWSIRSPYYNKTYQRELKKQIRIKVLSQNSIYK